MNQQKNKARPEPEKKSAPAVPESESVKGLRIILESLKKSGFDSNSEAVKKINALLMKQAL